MQKPAFPDLCSSEFLSSFPSIAPVPRRFLLWTPIPQRRRRRRRLLERALIYQRGGLPLMKRAQKSVVAVRSKMGGSPEGKVDPSRERGDGEVGSNNGPSVRTYIGACTRGVRRECAPLLARAARGPRPTDGPSRHTWWRRRAKREGDANSEEEEEEEESDLGSVGRGFRLCTVYLAHCY